VVGRIRFALERFGSPRHRSHVAQLFSLGGISRIMQPNMQQPDALFRAVLERRPDAVALSVAAGADPNADYYADYCGMRLVELAAYHGYHEVLEALIRAGAIVPRDAMRILGDQDITDWKIDPIELEPDYARVAQILLDHGATSDVLAYDGRPLIETFPARYYPHIHNVLSKGTTNHAA